MKGCGYIPYKKKSHDSLVFRVKTNNLEQQRSKKMCAQIVFTEQTSMFAEAHKQRPTNTHCTYLQTNKHSATLPASFLHLFIANRVITGQYVVSCCGKSTLLIVIVHICQRKVQTMFLCFYWNAAKVPPEGFFHVFTFVGLFLCTLLRCVHKNWSWRKTSQLL